MYLHYSVLKRFDTVKLVNARKFGENNLKSKYISEGGEQKEKQSHK